MKAHAMAWLLAASLIAGATAPGAFAAGNDDQIFKDEDQKKDSKKDTKKDDTGFARTMERFSEMLGWLDPIRRGLREEHREAIKAEKTTKEVKDLERKSKKYDVYVRALVQMRSRVNKAVGDGDLAAFKKEKGLADKLLALYEKWREAVKEHEEKATTEEEKAREPAKVATARRNVELAIMKLGLDKAPGRGETPEALDRLIDSGEIGDPGEVRKNIDRIRKEMDRRGRGRR